MHTKQRSVVNKILFLFCFVIGVPVLVNAQINEPSNNAVFPYLARMAQKGLIEWRDYILPIDRNTIVESLVELHKKKEKLSHTELKELNFFLQEFYFDKSNILPEDTALFQQNILSKDVAKRFRAYGARQSSFSLYADPQFGTRYTKYSFGRNNLQYYNGLRLYGKLGNKFGFQISFKDFTEKGDSLLDENSFNPNQGFIAQKRSAREVNYSMLNFSLSYKFKKGQVSIGKENITWGYGESGKLVLSDKSPSIPYLRFDILPFKWLHFNYFAGTLHSNIIDSSRTYVTGTGLNGGIREVYRSKYLFNHSITLTPWKGINFSFGESIVVSDKFDPAYLIPINFFRPYDHYASRQNSNASSNAQIFMMFSSRNNIKNTHVYAKLFIDELRLSTLFDTKNNRNQVGYCVGASVTDVGVNYLTIGAEYTHINPYVYNNLIPTVNYTNHDYLLGDWMGQNADRVILFVKHTPIARLKCKANFQFIRKGESAILLSNQFVGGSPTFLYKKLFSQTDLSLEASYQLIHTLNFFGSVNYQKRFFENSQSINVNSICFGFTYGW